MTCLVTLFDCKLQVFKNSPKWTIFGIFNQLLSIQNVNVARFAHNVEWDFFCVIFKHRGLQSFVREKCLDGVYQVYAKSSLEFHLVV